MGYSLHPLHANPTRSVASSRPPQSPPPHTTHYPPPPQNIKIPLPTLSSRNFWIKKKDSIFTRWPEAWPLQTITTDKVAQAFVNCRISRFGAPNRITMGQGRQFEYFLIPQTYLDWTLRLHRQLNAVIMCHADSSWSYYKPYSTNCLSSHPRRFSSYLNLIGCQNSLWWTYATVWRAHFGNQLFWPTRWSFLFHHPAPSPHDNLPLPPNIEKQTRLTETRLVWLRCQPIDIVFKI